MNAQSHGELQEITAKPLGALQTFLAVSNQAALPWKLFVGAIAAGGLISAKQLVEALVENYNNRASTIITTTSGGLKQLTTYECGEPGKLSHLICRKVSTLKDVSDRVAHLYSSAEVVELQLNTFMSRYPENVTVTLRRNEGLSRIGDNNSKLLQFTNDNTSAHSEGRKIAEEIEAKYPQLKNKVGVEGFGAFLTAEEIETYQKLLQKHGFNGELSLNGIGLFLNSTFKAPSLVGADKKIVDDLFYKYYGASQLILHGERTVGTYKYVDLVRAHIILLVLSLIAALVYGGLVLPLVGAKTLNKKLVAEEAGTMRFGRVTQEQRQRFNQWRALLGFQTYEEFTNLYNFLKEIQPGKVIKSRGNLNMWMKGFKGGWVTVTRMNQEYVNFYTENDLAITTTHMAYILQHLGVTPENAEFMDVEVTEVNVSR